MGLFDNLKGQRTTRGGVFFTPGVYKVVINRATEGVRRNGDAFFVVETEILESNSPERKAGSTCSWMIMKKWDMFPAYASDFLRAALFEYAKSKGTDPGVSDYNDINPTESEGDWAVSEDNPLAGIELELEAYDVSSKTTGKNFTRVIWTPGSLAK